jgi:hypothetical protein
VDCRRIRQHQFIQLAEAVGDLAAVERDVELAFFHIDARHDAKIAVIDVLVYQIRYQSAEQDNAEESPSSIDLLGDEIGCLAIAILFGNAARCTSASREHNC